jgi:hypothetical protein
MKIKVIGAGIYGCHITQQLIKKGLDVQLIEQNDLPMQLASGNNQFRLHQGFHYPRNFTTRNQSVTGFKEFKELYGDFTQSIERNLYAVVRDESLMDFTTYKHIMKAEGLDFKEEYEPLLNEKFIEGVINTNEEIVDVLGMQKFFKSTLQKYSSYNTKFDFQEDVESDHTIIDCTWGANSQNLDKDLFYEPTVLFYFTAEDSKFNNWSLTLVDGAFWSIYKTAVENQFTLSHVAFSSLGNYDEFSDAKHRITSISSDELRDIRNKMIVDVIKYFPNFTDQFKYLGDQLSIKTKKYSGSADRSCTVSRHKNVIEVMPGKLDTIFSAEREIVKILDESEFQ